MAAILIVLLVGASAGWLAGRLVTGSGFGIVGNIGIGIAGAAIGHLVLPRSEVAMGGPLRAVVAATVGAVILLVIVRMIRRA